MDTRSTKKQPSANKISREMEEWPVKPESRLRSRCPLILSITIAVRTTFTGRRCAYSVQFKYVAYVNTIFPFSFSSSSVYSRVCVVIATGKKLRSSWEKKKKAIHEITNVIQEKWFPLDAHSRAMHGSRSSCCCAQYTSCGFAVTHSFDYVFCHSCHCCCSTQTREKRFCARRMRCAATIVSQSPFYLNRKTSSCAYQFRLCHPNAGPKTRRTASDMAKWKMFIYRLRPRKFSDCTYGHGLLCQQNRTVGFRQSVWKCTLGSLYTKTCNDISKSENYY